MTQIFPLSEGVFTIGRDKIFQPFNEAKDELTDRPIGSLLVEVQPFVIVNDKDVILLDTGLGLNNPYSENSLPNLLAKHNLHPEDITKVLLSHLHKDHAGGLVEGAFPNAQIFIFEKEMQYAEEIGYPSYYPDDLKWLKDSNQVHWLQQDSGSIGDNIQYKLSGAHCPNHIIFTITDGDGRIIFYGGDEAPQHKQMKLKYIAKYDFDGRKAMALREGWAEEGKAGHWTFLFYHDITTPLATL